MYEAITVSFWTGIVVEAFEDLSLLLRDAMHETEAVGVVWLESARVCLAEFTQISEHPGALGAADARDLVQRGDEFIRSLLMQPLAHIGIQRSYRGAPKCSQAAAFDSVEPARVTAPRERSGDLLLVLWIHFEQALELCSSAGIGLPADRF